MRKQEGLPATPSQASGLRGGRGQTLLEILLAFSVSILVLSAVIGGVITTLSNTQYTKNQNLANFYAQEGMAVVRQIRDSSWPKFYSKTGDYCLDQNSIMLTDPNPPPQNCGQNVGIFSREAKIEHDSSDCSAGTPPTPTIGPTSTPAAPTVTPTPTPTITPTITPTPTPTIIPKGSKVTVKVSWSDSKCPVGTPLCHKVELITCFSNIDQRQEP